MPPVKLNGIYYKGAGLSEVFIESALAEVIPYSSASIIAFKDHLTISSHTESPCLTTGPKGSLETG
jgi:hypothetical protein